MDVDWQKFGKKAYQGLKDAGAPCTIICTEEDSNEDYDINTGTSTQVAVEYSSHAVIKNYTSESSQMINTEEVEISFHSGSSPDTIPDLTDTEIIQIVTQGKVFDIVNIQAIRPAGITMLYKARCVENRDE